jgi:hypothetical protein
MKRLKERPWIETHKGKGGEGDLDISGEEHNEALGKGKNWS